MHVRWRTAVTIGFVVVLLMPLGLTGDGVPLSSYPMYARPRSPEVTFIVPVGQTVSGDDVELSTRTIAGTADPLIAETYLRREVEGSRVEALCRAIAERTADGDIVAIEIRSERHHVVDRVLGLSTPLNSQLLTSCQVR